VNSKVRLVRRVAFSSGHRYWLASRSEEENRRIFGSWASRFNHGHNYLLYVGVDGPVDAVNGMVVNIKDIDEVLQERIVGKLDQRSLNDEVEWFLDRSTSTENILRFVAEELSSPGVLPGGVEMAHIRLDETPLLYGELDLKLNKTSLTRIYEFSAAHRLHVPSYSHEQNLALFGKCNNPAGHGHNYILEVTVSGLPDAETGMICDIGEMDQKVNSLVVDRYDHRNFNEDLPEFAGKTPTSEVVAQEIFARLDGSLPAKLERIRLHETARNIFEVFASA
jgi:6-pyruvoyltetrahydropterin/6-carboxytetrahydropterin synthase